MLPAEQNYIRVLLNVRYFMTYTNDREPYIG